MAAASLEISIQIEVARQKLREYRGEYVKDKLFCASSKVVSGDP